MDETKLNSNGTSGLRVRARPKHGRQNEPKYFDKHQHSGRFSCQFWAVITYGHHTPLVFICRRLPSEQ